MNSDAPFSCHVDVRMLLLLLLLRQLIEVVIGLDPWRVANAAVARNGVELREACKIIT
jgi:hypothetical protein